MVSQTNPAVNMVFRVRDEATPSLLAMAGGLQNVESRATGMSNAVQQGAQAFNLLWTSMNAAVRVPQLQATSEGLRSVGQGMQTIETRSSGVVGVLQRNSQAFLVFGAATAVAASSIAQLGVTLGLIPKSPAPNPVTIIIDKAEVSDASAAPPPPPPTNSM